MTECPFTHCQHIPSLKFIIEPTDWSLQSAVKGISLHVCKVRKLESAFGNKERSVNLTLTRSFLFIF